MAMWKFGSVVLLCNAEATADGESPKLQWPPSVDGARYVRMHNIYRCMHDVPALQWSSEIAKESQNWANKIGGDMQHGHLDEHAGGFNYLGQNLWSWWGGSEVDGIDGISSWYDEVKYTNNGKVSKYDASYGHYTQMVWQTTTHVGCGLWTTSSPEKKVMLVCDYGEGGNVQGSFDTQVLALNGRSFAQCESAVDSQLDPVVPKAVHIGFVPQGLAVSQNSGACAREYRLMLRGQSPALVALDSSGNPCDSSISKKDADVPWEWSTMGIFSGSSGSKMCLMMDRSKKLVTNSATSSYCTSENNNQAGGWKFNQKNLRDGFNMCMKDVPDTHSGVDVVTNLPTAGSPGSCSSNWYMSVFGDGDTVESTRKSCSACESEMGNFACATDQGCVLAPTDKDCSALGGEWCTGGGSGAACSAHPACGPLEGDCCPTADGLTLDCCSGSPTPTPPPTPPPASCKSHKACEALDGDCCPTSDGTMLGCCTQLDFMLV